jgi:hypothetical protein
MTSGAAPLNIDLSLVFALPIHRQTMAGPYWVSPSLLPSSDSYYTLASFLERRGETEYKSDVTDKVRYETMIASRYDQNVRTNRVSIFWPNHGRIFLNRLYSFTRCTLVLITSDDTMKRLNNTTNKLASY